MPGTLEIPELHVEGRDDLYTVAGLLQRHGVDMSAGNRPVEIKKAGTAKQRLDRIPIAVAAATSRPVGFVVDTDLAVVQRWTQVRDRLREAEVDPPDQCPAQGFIGQRRGYNAKVGVWLMPDCSMDMGKLENLLETLIPAGDRLWAYAQASTDEAKRSNGAAFREVDRDKACIHCWLAWQETPGLPFGTAVKAKFFGHDSPQALAFLRWMRDVFGLARLINI